MAAENNSLPWWYQLVLTVGIPGACGLTAAPPQTLFKQLQANQMQPGLNESLLAMKGLGSTAAQMGCRIVLRTCFIPSAKEMAATHKPATMNTQTAQNIATTAALVGGDAVNTFTERTATQQQTSGLPKNASSYPSFGYYWKTSSSPLHFLGRIYGFGDNLKGGAIAALMMRSAPLLGAITFTRSAATETYKPKTLGQKILVDASATAVGTAVNVVATPLALVTQLTMHYRPMSLVDAFGKAIINPVREFCHQVNEKPRTIVEAGAELLGKTHRGAGSRLFISALGGGVTATTMTLQDMFTRHMKSGDRSR